MNGKTARLLRKLNKSNPNKNVYRQSKAMYTNKYKKSNCYKSIVILLSITKAENRYNRLHKV